MRGGSVGVSRLTGSEQPRAGRRAAVGGRSYTPTVDLPLDLEVVRATLRRHGVAFAFVHGSYAHGTASAGSDVDLAVWAPEPIDAWVLGGELPDVVDLLDLAGAPEPLAGRVAMDGVLVLDDDPPARVRWQADTRKRYLDEAPRRDRFRRDFIAAHG